jgi:hypothetical protein
MNFNKKINTEKSCDWVYVGEHVWVYGRLFQYVYYFNVFQIQPGDGLPANVCEQCENLVNICYNFKLQVEQSDFTLQKYYASQQEHLPFPQVWCRPVLNFIIK